MEIVYRAIDAGSVECTISVQTTRTGGDGVDARVRAGGCCCSCQSLLCKSQQTFSVLYCLVETRTGVRSDPFQAEWSGKEIERSSRGRRDGSGPTEARRKQSLLNELALYWYTVCACCSRQHLNS